MTPTPWGSPEEVERRRRIRLSVWAYAYEVLDVSLVDDHRFDDEALLVDLTVATGSPQLDAFFRRYFEAHTGQWVTKHPERQKLDTLTRAIVARNNQEVTE